MVYEQMRIYKFEAKEYLSELFVYFDGEEKKENRKSENYWLTSRKNKNQDWEKNNLNIASRLFDFYQPLLNVEF